MAKLGEILISKGQLDNDQLNSGLAQQRQWAGLIGQILIEMELCDEMAVYDALASQFGIKLASIASINIHPDIVRTIPAALCKEKRVFPVHFANKQLMVATAFPQDVQTPDQIAFQTGLRVQLVLVAEREIEWAIRRYHQNDQSPCPPAKTKKALPKEEEMKLLDAAGKTMIGKTMEDLKREHDAAQGHNATPPAQAPAAPAGGQQPRPAGHTLTGAFPAVPQHPNMQGQNLDEVIGLVRIQEQQLAQQSNMLKLLVQMCIRKGVFTQAEFLAITQQRQGGYGQGS